MPSYPQNLPPIEDIEDQFRSPDALTAYEVCLDFQRHARNESGNPIINARVLGFLILNTSVPKVSEQVAKEILLCNKNYTQLSVLGDFYVKWFIQPFKNFKRRTTTMDGHPMLPSFDQDKANILAEIWEAPKDHAKAKKQALIRDNHRCVVTGVYDVKAGVPGEETRKFGNSVHTKHAHILPPSIYFNVSGTDPTTSSRKDYSASVLAVLKHFGYDVKELNGTKVHSLPNTVTMEGNVHKLFNRLELWLEPTAIPHCYKVHTASERIVYPGLVTLTTPDSAKFPLPSPTLLGLHAVCAQVAHLSGVAKRLDKFDCDLDG